MYVWMGEMGKILNCKSLTHYRHRVRGQWNWANDQIPDLLSNGPALPPLPRPPHIMMLIIYNNNIDYKHMQIHIENHNAQAPSRRVWRVVWCHPNKKNSLILYSPPMPMERWVKCLRHSRNSWSALWIRTLHQPPHHFLLHIWPSALIAVVSTQFSCAVRNDQHLRFSHCQFDLPLKWSSNW